MKERIVLDFGAELKNICNGCAEGVKAKCKQTQKDHLQCVLQKSELEEFEIEQMPETFTELIKLCQTLNTDRIRTTKQVIYIKPTSCWLREIRVNCMGAIMNSDFQDIAYHRSMPQLWSFIKSLIGEE